jgi:hypothetical protein
LGSILYQTPLCPNQRLLEQVSQNTENKTIAVYWSHVLIVFSFLESIRPICSSPTAWVDVVQREGDILKQSYK